MFTAFKGLLLHSSISHELLYLFSRDLVAYFFMPVYHYLDFIVGNEQKINKNRTCKLNRYLSAVLHNMKLIVLLIHETYDAVCIRVLFVSYIIDISVFEYSMSHVCVYHFKTFPALK